MHISGHSDFGILSNLGPAILISFTRHGWFLRYFQFSPRVFEDFSAFFIIRIDEVKSPLFLQALPSFASITVSFGLHSR